MNRRDQSTKQVHTQEDAVRSMFWQMLGALMAVGILVGGSYLIKHGVETMSNDSLMDEYDQGVKEWTNNWLP